MKQGINSAQMRKRNRSLVLDVVRRREPIARAEVARLTGLGKPTVSTLVNELLSAGVIEEAGEGASGGRPSILLQFVARSQAHLAAHIGVNTTSVLVADGTGRMLSRKSAPSVHGRPQAGLDTLSRLRESALLSAGLDIGLVKGSSVAIPAMIDRATGWLSIAPNLDWKDFPIQQAASSAMGVPTTVHNITKAAAFAEACIGTAAGVETFAWIYAGSGIGSGLVVDGKLVEGANGHAGEIGHCQVVDNGPPCGCGATGCVETLASTIAIESAVRDALRAGRSASFARNAAPSSQEVVAAAADGDDVAGAVLSNAATVLGRGVSYLVRLLDPSIVVLGGPLAAAGELLIDPVQAAVRSGSRGPNPVSVVCSTVPGNAPLLGALLLAMDAAGAPLPETVDHIVDATAGATT